MKRFILVFLITFCTIGGEEAEMVATIENTVELEEQEEEEESTFQNYEVPLRSDWVVLDALNYVKDHIDGTCLLYTSDAADE